MMMMMTMMRWSNARALNEMKKNYDRYGQSILAGAIIVSQSAEYIGRIRCWPATIPLTMVACVCTAAAADETGRHPVSNITLFRCRARLFKVTHKLCIRYWKLVKPCSGCVVRQQSNKALTAQHICTCKTVYLYIGHIWPPFSLLRQQWWP